MSEVARAIALIQELHGNGSTTDTAPTPQTSSLTEEQTSESVKRELVYLRARVRKLEAERTSLEERTKATRVWKQVADRQSAQRYAAELENAKLRVILDTQLQMGKQLMRVLEHESPQLVPSGPHFHISFPDVLMNSRAEQTACVDKLYQQSHDVFARFPDGLTTIVREMSVEEDADGVITIEARMGWVLPFAADRVLDVMWRLTRTQVEERGHVTEEHGSLFVEFDAAKLRAISAAGWQLTKQYASQDGVPVTLVSQSSAKFTKPSKGTGVAVGVQYQGESWVRLVGSVLNDQAMTSIQVVRRDRSAYVTDKSSAQQAIAGTSADHMLAFIDLELTRVQQCIENLLFAPSTEGK
ncbi:hypothetical protein Poli38472_007250 [Pythium oligandrum]|uniref:Uncharacterized protein n=1 Tax=Pythium oligandrum TaxID=41045 RepID=A0A8K1CA60_PYTOL|nr:hypothetical protein Poli38472_007250 [Pythium oligandrum]|eukprot:TMW59105.1 hypothetical protein Poli38472_007250 [Pythium oligandrum]